MRRLRGGVIGCGMVAEFHLQGWVSLDDVEIVALVDPDRALADALRQRFVPDAQVFETVEAMLDATRLELDFVDILSPPALHAEHAVLARDGGLHVSVQKPLTDDLTSAAGVVTAFEGYEQLLVVHENHVLRPWFARTLELARAGSLGAISSVRLEQRDPASPPQRSNREAEHGVLLQYGIHLIDMVRELLGVPDSVRATLRTANPEVRGESFAEVVLGYGADSEHPGCEATVIVSWGDDAASAASAGDGMRVVGSAAEVRYEGTMTRSSEPSSFSVSVDGVPLVDEVREPTADYLGSFREFERRFVDAVRSGSGMRGQAAANLVTLAITFAAIEAARLGQAVDFAGFAAGASIPLPAKETAG